MTTTNNCAILPKRMHCFFGFLLLHNATCRRSLDGFSRRDLDYGYFSNERSLFSRGGSRRVEGHNHLHYQPQSPSSAVQHRQQQRPPENGNQLSPTQQFDTKIESFSDIFVPPPPPRPPPPRSPPPLRPSFPGTQSAATSDAFHHQESRAIQFRPPPPPPRSPPPPPYTPHQYKIQPVLGPARPIRPPPPPPPPRQPFCLSTRPSSASSILETTVTNPPIAVQSEQSFRESADRPLKITRPPPPPLAELEEKLRREHRAPMPASLSTTITPSLSLEPLQMLPRHQQARNTLHDIDAIDIVAEEDDDDDELREEDEFILFESNLDVPRDCVVEEQTYFDVLDASPEGNSLYLSPQEVLESIVEYERKAIETNLDREVLLPLWAILSSLMFRVEPHELAATVRRSASVLRESAICRNDAFVLSQVLPFATRYAHRMDAYLRLFINVVAILNTMRFLPKPPRKMRRRVKRRVQRVRKIPRRTKLSDLDDYDLDDAEFNDLISEVRLPAFREEKYWDVEEVDEVFLEKETPAPRPRHSGLKVLSTSFFHARLLQYQRSFNQKQHKIGWDGSMVEEDEQLGLDEIRLLEAANENVWVDLDNIDCMRNADDTSSEYEDEYEYQDEWEYEHEYDVGREETVRPDTFDMKLGAESDAVISESDWEDWSDASDLDAQATVPLSKTKDHAASAFVQATRAIPSVEEDYVPGKESHTALDRSEYMYNNPEPTIEITMYSNGFEPIPTPRKRRSLLSRILWPFSSGDHDNVDPAIDPTPLLSRSARLDTVSSNKVEDKERFSLNTDIAATETPVTPLKPVDWKMMGKSRSPFRFGKRLFAFWPKKFFNKSASGVDADVDEEKNLVEELADTAAEFDGLNLGQSAVDDVTHKSVSRPQAALPDHPPTTF